jgi:hypothetical protein
MKNCREGICETNVERRKKWKKEYKGVKVGVQARGRGEYGFRPNEETPDVPVSACWKSLLPTCRVSCCNVYIFGTFIVPIYLY